MVSLLARGGGPNAGDMPLWASVPTRCGLTMAASLAARSAPVGDWCGAGPLDTARSGYWGGRDEVSAPPAALSMGSSVLLRVGV